jgi:hypothetical protein
MREPTQLVNPRKNWNCDNDKCKDPKSEVRVYPIGSGGNLILCQACFAYENDYNRRRARETKQPKFFPQQNWEDAEVYK